MVQENKDYSSSSLFKNEEAAQKEMDFSSSSLFEKEETDQKDQDYSSSSLFSGEAPSLSSPISSPTISGDPRDEGFGSVLSRTVDELQASGWAGVRVLMPVIAALPLTINK